jgi:carboxyl-terminal processing protease
VTETGKKYKTWEPLLLSMMVVVGMIAGVKLAQSNTKSLKPETAITNTRYSGRQVEEIIRFLETRYVNDVETDALVEKAIQSILQGLDPHTHYFPPDQVTEIEERNGGQYVGIGVEVAFIRDSLIILYPRKDSPAEKAGLRPGDFILSVNGREIKNDTLEQKEILSLIKGIKGTKVNLVVKSIASKELRTVEVLREEIKVPSVVAAYMIDSSVAYIKIQRFTNSTYREFMDEWERLATKRHAEHLILDLRDNPGGYLKEAVNILSQIIEEEGKLLVYTEGEHQQRIEYKSTGKIFFPISNVTVLINEGSASASEIIAGCLQDQDRGLIIGSPSYGKGLVQEQYELSNGGTLRLTISKYYTPSGRSIQKAYDTTTSVVDTQLIYRTVSGRPVHAGGGIMPDIQVKDVIDWNQPEQLAWMDIISEYAIRYNIKEHDGQIIPVEQIEDVMNNLPPDDVILRELMALGTLGKKEDVPGLLSFLKNNQNDILQIAHATMVAYRTREEGWYIAFNEDDPVVQKARSMAKLDLLMALESK